MKINGGCHCGAIRFEAEADPNTAAICHCTDCQTLSGTAFRTVIPVNEDSFKLLQGTPKEYVKTAESGNKRIQAFCGDCGTPFYATSISDGPRTFNLRLGCVQQRDEFEPKVQIWARSAQNWLGGLDGIKKVETQ
jgi:hypothetical protein